MINILSNQAPFVTFWLIYVTQFYCKGKPLPLICVNFSNIFYKTTVFRYFYLTLFRE